VIADVPAGGQDVPGLLASIDARLASIGGELARLEDEEIPGVERRSADQAAENRRLTWRIAVVLALAAALAISALAWWNVRQDAGHNAQQDAQERQVAAIARGNCIAANQTRAADLAAEERLIPAALGATREGRAEAAVILAEFRAKDRPRPCPR